MLLGDPGTGRRAVVRRTSVGLGSVVAGAIVAFALAAAGALVSGAWSPGRLASGVALDFGDYTHQVELDRYGPRGSYIVGYDHDALVEVRFPLSNDGLVATTVTGIEPFPEPLAMLVVERVTVDGEPMGAQPVSLAPGQQAIVAVTARFDNCEYYTERAINLFDGARVHLTALGVDSVATVGYDHQVVLRSPTINGCPGRVMDRSAKQRSEDATITGRG